MITGLLDSTTTRWLETKHPALQTAFDWLRAMPASPPDGITELDGPELYVNVHGYDTKPAEQCRWESHRHTIDIQYCIAGGEAIDWTHAGRLDSLNDYDATKEVEHWKGDDALIATRLKMLPGSYVLFVPNEPHRPKVYDGQHPSIRKLVFKIDAKRLGLK